MSLKRERAGQRKVNMGMINNDIEMDDDDDDYDVEQARRRRR